MRYIAALDVGTTSVRCFVIDETCEVRGCAQEPVELLNPQPGYFEIEPESLWRKIVEVLTRALRVSELVPTQLTCLTLCTQRCTFLTWDHRSQEYYHNFITWKDLRADALVDSWNDSYTMKLLNGCSYALYLATRSKRFLAGSVIKMMNGQVTLRLLHELQNNARLKKAVREKKARVELLDSWILYKLRSGNGLDPNVEHITDVTSAAATGMFDPFTLNWSPHIKTIFGIDLKLLPKLVDNAYMHFGRVHGAVFGPKWKETAVPIACSISDQTAAMWGSQCFGDGDVKVTMGTGAFLNLITGHSCLASMAGMYPLVAWQFKLENKDKRREPLAGTTFCMEGAAHDMGTVISWAQSCGLFADPAETAELASSVPNTGGVYFIPAFSGLGAPINDHKAASGFIGITPSTTRAHLVRATLESIAFRLVQLCQTTEEETKYTLKLLRVDGGVSRNNFVCQFLADASGIRVERAQNSEASVMGATYMAGLNLGIWKSLETLRTFRKVEQVFEPNKALYNSLQAHMKMWNKAVERFGSWY